MKIVISGIAGAGKSTVAKYIAQVMNLKHHSVGDFMRELAKEKGITLHALGELAEKDSKIDKEIDDMSRALDKEDGFVIDSRLGVLFIPSADIKILLICDDIVRAERVLAAGRADESAKTVEEVVEAIHGREDSESVRYKKYYNFDYTDPHLYDLVLDTTYLGIEQVEEKIVMFIKNKMNIS